MHLGSQFELGPAQRFTNRQSFVQVLPELATQEIGRDQRRSHRAVRNLGRPNHCMTAAIEEPQTQGVLRRLIHNVGAVAGFSEHDLGSATPVDNVLDAQRNWEFHFGRPIAERIPLAIPFSRVLEAVQVVIGEHCRLHGCRRHG